MSFRPGNTQDPGRLSGVLRSRGRAVLSLLFALTFLTSAGMLALRVRADRASAAANDRAAELAGLAAPEPRPAAPRPDPEGAGSVPEEPERSVSFPADVDLAALRAENPDVVGWLIIPDTEVSYPLLQARDNSCYLRRDWTGQHSRAGSLFLDFRNSAALDDPSTVIYGHRMRNGSMFGSLIHYSSQSYWEAHPTVYLATQSGRFRGEIFAAYETEITDSIYQVGQPGGEDRRMEDRLARSAIRTGVMPGPEDRILTLSTCTVTSSRRTRWVVQAVLFDITE